MSKELVVKNLSVGYSEIQVLKDVSIEQGLWIEDGLKSMK